MSNRASCPSCGSATALGEVKCFKCSYRAKKYNRNYIFDHLGIDKENQNDLKVPEDVIFDTHNFHIDALRWLYKYHMYKSSITKFKIGYLPGWHRVFLPAFDTQGSLKFYQLRSLRAEDTVRYLTFGNKVNMWALYSNNESRRLVIAEDNLSSIRLSKFSSALALHGTSIRTTLIKELVNDYDEFVVWLDPDRPGLVAKNNVIKQLIAEIGLNLQNAIWLNKEYLGKNIYTINQKSIDKDPKYYTDIELQYILSNELNEADI